MKEQAKRAIRHFIYLIILIVFDQYTKHLAVVHLKGQDPIKLLPGVLHLQYLENDGAVFGILGGTVQALSIVTFILTIVLIYFYIRLPEDKKYNILRILLVFIIAGAVGNLIDRIAYGYVVDFIYFALINFPIFNIADSYVTVATLFIVLLGIFYYKDEDFNFLENKSSRE